jgi:phosphate transport system substrate-binding protein
MKIVLLFFIAFAILSCNRGNQPVNPNIETARNGKFKMVVDESFKPIIDSQIEVFQSAYPNVKIDVVYTTEAACFKAWDEDSATRLIITTKSFNEEEGKFYRKKFLNGYMSEKVALDAVAVILNKNAKDSLLTLQDLKDAMLGKSKYGYKAVFDGLKETSNLRFMMDSVLKTDSMPPTVRGLDSNKAVINFVSKNASAIGFIGVNWIGSGDPDDLKFLGNIKVAAIQCQNNCPS